MSNPKVLQVDFSNEESFEKAKLNEDTENAQVSTIPGTVEDWLREQDMKRERGELVSIDRLEILYFIVQISQLIIIIKYIYFLIKHVSWWCDSFKFNSFHK